MTKFYFALLLSLYTLTLHAQKSIFNKLYFDGEFGLISYGDNTWSPLGAIDISLGYRLDPEWAIGASLIGWVKPSECCPTGASGTGLQLRYTPSASRLMLKAETGYLLSTSYGSDGIYPPQKNTSRSNKHYFRVSADWRFNKITTGLTWAAADHQVYDYFDEMNQLTFTEYINVRAVTFHVGLSFPRVAGKPHFEE